MVKPNPLTEKPHPLVKPGEIKPSNKAMVVRGVYNPGAVRAKNGKIMLMARVAETPIHGERYFLAPNMVGTKSFKMSIEKIPKASGQLSWETFITKNGLCRLPITSHFRKLIVDEEGGFVETISQKPDFYGIKGDGDFGVEDPRITRLEEKGLYAMTYVSISYGCGISTSLAVSRDLKNWRRRGIIFSQQNKDVVIFPEKVKGYYVAYHRPEGTMHFDKPSIWVSYSKDLEFWGREKPVLVPRDSWEKYWRIGAGAPPVRIDEGFLSICHGVRLVGKEQKRMYVACAALIDPKDPEKILAKSPMNRPLFRPEAKFEKEGFINNVVFPTGAVFSDNKKNLLIYSGAADTRIEVRKFSVKSILNNMDFL